MNEQFNFKTIFTDSRNAYYYLRDSYVFEMVLLLNQPHSVINGYNQQLWKKWTWGASYLDKLIEKFTI